MRAFRIDGNTDVIIKLLRITAIGVLVLLLLAVAASRLRGFALVLASGEIVGYVPLTQEWLFAEYPAVPVRRDGPYVLDAGNRRETLTLTAPANGATRVTRAPTGEAVEVVADGTNLRFSVPLRARHPRAAVEWPMPAQLLVVSDLEGEFDAAVRLLRAQGVIDEQLQWSYGKGHLVLIGDQVDRGDNVVPLLWLIYKLEAEAQAGGGAVHYVLGNHEQYLLQGRAKAAHSKYLGTARATGLQYGELWSEHSELGRWLRSKPVMIQVGETLFTHGGVSPKVLALKPDLATIDALAARYIGATQRTDDALGATIIQRDTGLMWYRGLAAADDSEPLADTEQVARVLRHFGADHIAIGHTLVQHVGHTHGGRVLRAGVAHADGVNEAIVWRDGRWWRVDARGAREPLAVAVNRGL